MGGVDRSGPSLSAVVLTMGDRPGVLGRALSSVLDGSGDGVEMVLVGNGLDPQSCLRAVGSMSEGSEAHRAAGASIDRSRIRLLHLEHNVGIPAGRNRGVEAAAGTYLLFLDDDAALLDSGTTRRLIELFEADPRLGAIALRLVDENGRTAGRHLPRLAKHRPHLPGQVAAFPGGAVAIRREALAGVGGYCDEFFYGMEESDLALRLVDAGWRIWFAADEQVFHPRTDPSRHPDAYWRLARNRVWLAHRNLPGPIAMVYLGVRALLTVIRQPSLLASQWSGYRDGWRTRIGPRRPISWRTVWQLTRLGRPPVL